MGVKKERERELLEQFEAAKNSAKEAEESRCLDALSKLQAFPVTIQTLVSTQVGKRIRALTKHTSKDIQNLASDILHSWNNMVLDHSNNGKARNDKVRESTMPKPPAKVWAENRSNNSVNPLKDLTDVDLKPDGKCNDALRDKIREQLLEALRRVYGESSDEIRQEVRACDPVQVAVSVESAMFQEWGQSTGSHKAKYRSIMFNVKDAKNPDFRRKLLLGSVEPERVVELRSEGMASDARQRENENIKAKALSDRQLGGVPQATTDQFKCGQRKTTYHQLQTRSADEPMTTYVTCVNCNHRWKFG